MTSATMSLTEVAEFWRTARRLYVIYAALDRTFEIGLPPCSDLESPSDRSEPQILERVRNWFDEMDGRVQVWQIRQLLQSTNLQTEENLRGLILRHLHKSEKTDADRDKIDFLLVQYYAHCAPTGLQEEQITLEEVAQVLEPALGIKPDKFPTWATQLDEKIQKLNQSISLEALQESGALVEARALKEAGDERYFDPASLVVFTRFNFLARRAFFRAMHLDLHAIRDAMAELENLGHETIDCTEAGLTDSETMEHIRHVVHQWKTPFRAPYTGGASFMQLVQMRQVLERTLSVAKAGGAPSAGRVESNASSKTSEIAASTQASMPAASQDHKDGAKASMKAAPKEIVKPKAPAAKVVAMPAPAVQPAAVAEAAAAEAAGASQEISELPPLPAEESDFLRQCVADLTAQLVAQKVPDRIPSVSSIKLAGCKLLIATWEAEAFTEEQTELAQALQRTVAARTILHVSLERLKKSEPTDLGVALDIAHNQIEEMKIEVAKAKEAANIDAAVNLAATTKRLLSLVQEAEKLRA